MRAYTYVHKPIPRKNTPRDPTLDSVSRPKGGPGRLRVLSPSIYGIISYRGRPQVTNVNIGGGSITSYFVATAVERRDLYRGFSVGSTVEQNTHMLLRSILTFFEEI